MSRFDAINLVEAMEAMMKRMIEMAGQDGQPDRSALDRVKEEIVDILTGRE